MGRVNIMKFLLPLLILINLLYAEGGHYKAYMPWETDSIFVAWLIKRYVDKEAVFSTVPKSEKIAKKYAINTANSRMRRSARFTAFEEAARIYKIDNKCVEKLRPIIRILEMTPWRKEGDMHALHFEQGIVPLLPTKAGEHSLNKVFTYIDNYCKGVK
jgi:hypothetical protein